MLYGDSMKPHPVPHGFAAVDAQLQPAAFVAVLERLSTAPFYASYKRRLRELVSGQAGGRFLDVGAGAGDGALAFSSEYGAEVVPIDRSLTLAAAMADRGVPNAIAADGWAERELMSVSPSHTPRARSGPPAWAKAAMISW